MQDLPKSPLNVLRKKQIQNREQLPVSVFVDPQQVPYFFLVASQLDVNPSVVNSPTSLLSCALPVMAIDS